MYNKSYELTAASVRGIAFESSKTKTTRCDKETELLFFWIMSKMVKEIHYNNNIEGKYCLILEDKHNKLLCDEEYYFPRFVFGEEYYNVLRRIAKTFNKLKGYSAIYCNGKQTEIKINLRIV